MPCRICGGPLPVGTTGRPRTYCGTPCRRSAELEIRRLDRRLGDLEERLAELRISTLHVFGDDPKRLQAEIKRVRARLLVLLGAGAPEPAVT